MSSPTQALAATIYNHVREVYGFPPAAVKLEIQLLNGKPVAFELDQSTLRAEADAPDMEGLRPKEKAVLDVLADLDAGESMTGKEIAKAAGEQFDADYSRILSKMVKAELISKSQTGYSLP